MYVQISTFLFFLTDLEVYTNCLLVTLNSRKYVRGGSTIDGSFSLPVISGDSQVATFAINGGVYHIYH